jgi:hypothetical protein
MPLAKSNEWDGELVSAGGVAGDGRDHSSIENKFPVGNTERLVCRPKELKSFLKYALNCLGNGLLFL